MVNNTLINRTEFQFISPITPEVDGLGNIIEERPAPRYRNVRGLSLNTYGNGPFCRFKIPASPIDARVLDNIGVYAILDEKMAVL